MSREQIRKTEQLIEVILRMIPKEREAAKMYRDTAAGAPNEMLRLLFDRLAQQEELHEKKLRAVLDVLECEIEELASSDS